MTWYGVTISSEAIVLIVVLVGTTVGIVNFLEPGLFRLGFSDRIRKFWRQDALINNSVLATLLLLIGVVIFHGFESCDTDGSCLNKFQLLLASGPNEFGDALAGISATLAFLWIIVTVVMQSQELRAQREELSLARKEFTRMAKAQEEQVSLIVAQTELLKDGQRQRDETREKEKFDGLLFQLSRTIEMVQPALYWDFQDRAKQFDTPYPPRTQKIHRLFLFSEERNDVIDERIHAHVKKVLHFMLVFENVRRSSTMTFRPSEVYLGPIVRALGDLLEEAEQSGQSTRARVNHLFLRSMHDQLAEMEKMNIWKKKEI